MDRVFIACLCVVDDGDDGDTSASAKRNMRLELPR